MMRRNRIPRFLLPALLVTAAWCGRSALAQTVQQQGLRPVEQMVEDIDPTQISLRRENAGLATLGERQNVFRRIVPDAGPYSPGSQRLYFISYGIVAEFDRSEYGMLMKQGKPTGAILQVIPPNTVFHVGLPPPIKPSLDPDAIVPGMVQGRIDARVHSPPQVGGPVTGRWIAPSQSREIDREQADAQRYQEMLVAQRGLVVAALGRIARSAAP